MQYILMLSLVALASCYEYKSIAHPKSMSVKGKLKCGDQPASNVKVTLFAKDTGSGPDPPEKFGDTLTDEQGNFRISDVIDQEFPTNPVLKFYHSCNDKKPKLGLRKAAVMIPTDYVTQGRVSLKTFDAGTINLELGFPGEQRQK